MLTLQAKIDKILPILNEKQRRLYLISEAEAIGRGGKWIISKIAKVSRPTLDKAAQELKELSNSPVVDSKVRRQGGGRKKITKTDTGILHALEKLVGPVSRGDPEPALRWTIKSVRTLSEELCKQGHKVGKTVVGKLLAELGYSLQSNQKKIEGNQHPDRNGQFEHINHRCGLFIAAGFPVISVDTKKKEKIGNYKNSGKEYRTKKDAREVEMHDFAKDKAIPYGVYDIDKNNAFVNVGKNCDTGQFAVASIREWWFNMGKMQYPNTTKLLINADGGRQ